MAQKFREELNTNTTRRAFASLLDPLERAAGRRLGNPKRGDCFKEFQRFPEAVRRVAEDALVDAQKNPVGLFAYRIANGWHELEPLPKRRIDENRGPGTREEWAALFPSATPEELEALLPPSLPGRAETE